MVPCEAQADKQFLSLSVGDDNAVEIVKGIPTLEAGKSYTYHLTVGKNKVEVNGITVEDWTTGTTIANGEATWIPYVSFTAAATQTFQMTTSGNYTISNLEYSLDGSKWNAVEVDKEVEFGGEKGCLFLRGKNPNGTANDYSNYSTINFTNENVKVACTGDIRTLLDWEDYKNVETGNAHFIKLFYFNHALTSAPALPATTLAGYCYYCMFFYCSSLKTAPSLPATTLASNCYFKMFDGCTKLTSITMLAPSTAISDAMASRFLLSNAGTDASVTSRTLKVKDKAAYDALVSQELPDNWKIGNCTVLDENDNPITEDSNN